MPLGQEAVGQQGQVWTGTPGQGRCQRWGQMGTDARGLSQWAGAHTYALTETAVTCPPRSCSQAPSPSKPFPEHSLQPHRGSQVTHCQVAAWRPHGVRVQSSAAWGASMPRPAWVCGCWGGHGGRGCRHSLRGPAPSGSASQGGPRSRPRPAGGAAGRPGGPERTGSRLQGVCVWGGGSAVRSPLQGGGGTSLGRSPPRQLVPLHMPQGGPLTQGRPCMIRPR